MSCTSVKSYCCRKPEDDIGTTAGISRVRTKIPLDVQIRVFFRDGWLCRWCHRPTVFSPTFRLMQILVQASGHAAPLAYFHKNWRRDASPLLDHMGAVIDHIEPFGRGGVHGEANFATACNKCNARKNSRSAATYQSDRPGKPVKGRFGEPKHWDGLSSLFLVLARNGIALTSGEKAWRKALEAHMILSS